MNNQSSDNIIAQCPSTINKELKQKLKDNFISVNDGVMIYLLEFYGFNIERSEFEKIYTDIILLNSYPKDLRLEFACYCIAYLGKSFDYVINKFMKHMKTIYQDFKAYWDDYTPFLRMILPTGYGIINENGNHYELDNDQIKTLCLKMLENGFNKSNGNLNKFLHENYNDISQHEFTENENHLCSCMSSSLRTELLHYRNKVRNTQTWHIMERLRISSW